MDFLGWSLYRNADSMSSSVEDEEDLDPDTKKKTNGTYSIGRFGKTISWSRYNGDYEFQQKTKTNLSKDHPKTAFFKPRVAPTLYQALPMVGWASQNLFSPAICQPPHATGSSSSVQSLYALSLHNFMASSLSSPKPLHLLTRFLCFSNTWMHPTGSTFHPTPFLNQNLYSIISNASNTIHHTSLYSQPIKYPDIHPHILFLSMENSSTPPTTSTTTSTTSISSEFSSIYEPVTLNNFPPNPPPFYHAAPEPGLQLPHSYPGQPFGYPGHHFMSGESRNDFGWLPTPIQASEGGQGSFLVQNDGLNNPQERRTVLDPYTTKVARINRRMARQRSLSMQRSASAAAASSGAQSSHQEAETVMRSHKTKRADMYTFTTPDNKRLRVLLNKDLKKSDVASLGRIVLPKREAEENLPILSGKEGISITIRDVYSNQTWTIKYKFWTNNKSRMYVLENTGDFVRQNGLEAGDSLTLYEDESENLYFSLKKASRMGAEYSRTQRDVNNNNNELDMSNTYQAGDEEDSSLAILIEQLSQQEQQYNDIMALPMTSNAYYPSMPPDQEAVEDYRDGKAGSSSITKDKTTDCAMIAPSSSTSRAGNDNQFMNFDDCYGDLDMLPDVDHYNFSP